ncbi:MAG: flagellar biosynthetic protein FliO [Planctomycetes bacterium]|nr:flagellar biosynthetic protein FliO [Planctomycetota bacterium]
MKNKCLIVFLLLMLFVCSNAYCDITSTQKTDKPGSAATEFDGVGVVSPFNFSKITKVLESTGLVILIIVVTVFFIRRKLGIKTGMNRRRRHVHIVDTASLGSKRHIHLIKIPGKLLLVGATNERIQSLAEITEKEIVESIDTESQGSEFMKFFKRTYTERT